MRLVVLDGYTLNPGDLTWEPLAALGDLTVYQRTPPDLTVERSAGAEVLLTNKVVVDDHVMGHLPSLQYIGILATGYNVVDVAAAAARGITVTNVPAYSTESVVQMTMALMLELALRVGDHWSGVRAGRWSASADFSYHDHTLMELAGKVLGIVGFGSIGRRVAEAASALGMEVIVSTRSPGVGDGVNHVDVDTLFAQADVVSLHCPLTSDNVGLVSARRIARMKPTACLINTARGPLVDEGALAEALNAGRIAGAAVDVLSTEPPPADNPLLKAANCVVTPHIAWATVAARRRLMDAVVDNLRAWREGRPVNVLT